MTRRDTVVRVGMGAGAVVCLLLALVLVLFAVDVARWHHAMEAGDVRYPGSTEETRLWDADALLPLDPARSALSIGDDVDLREALRAFRLADLDNAVVSDPELAIKRNEAQAKLEALLATGKDGATRSRAASLLGVLGLARFQYATQDREGLLSGTISNLKLAIDLDPTNAEPKYNLELAYQHGRGLQLAEASAGQNPSPGGQGSQGAGAGEAGSGY